MKKVLVDFAGGMLSRDQMKQIKGGAIYCTCDYGWTFQSGRCSGSSVSACEGYGCGNGGKMRGCSQR